MRPSLQQHTQDTNIGLLWVTFYHLLLPLLGPVHQDTSWLFGLHACAAEVISGSHTHTQHTHDQRHCDHDSAKISRLLHLKLHFKHALSTHPPRSFMSVASASTAITSLATAKVAG